VTNFGSQKSDTLENDTDTLEARDVGVCGMVFRFGYISVRFLK